MTFYIHVRFRHLYQIARYIRLSVPIKYCNSLLFYSILFYIQTGKFMRSTFLFFLFVFFLRNLFFPNKILLNFKFEYIFFPRCQIIKKKLRNHIFIKFSVSCSTVTVTKCQAALRTLQAFPFFRPTCLCKEPGIDPDCNYFRDFLFDHPCGFVLKRGKFLYFFFPKVHIKYYTL